MPMKGANLQGIWSSMSVAQSRNVPIALTPEECGTVIAELKKYVELKALVKSYQYHVENKRETGEKMFAEWRRSR